MAKLLVLFFQLFLVTVPLVTRVLAEDPAYCGAPPRKVSGAAPPGMTLRFLMVTTRHGDRTPIAQYPGGAANAVEWRCNLTYLSMLNNGEEAQVKSGRLFRTRYLDDRNVLPGNCMYGQLTDKGQAQHLTLGSSLRDVYVNNYGFLNPLLSSQEVYVRSTDVPRTIASAQSLLTGMYPSSSSAEGTPVVDIHTMDKVIDNMTPNTKLCPYLQHVYDELEKAPLWLAHEKEIAPLDAKIRPIFNLAANADVDMNGVFDVTYARMCHGMQVPEGITPLADSIYTNAAFETSYFYNATALALSLGIGSFVSEQVAQLERAVNGSTGPLKFILWSGHDTTLWPLSFAYGFGDLYYWPPYASHMEIELWQSTATPFDYYVRIVYNDRVMPVLGCSTAGPCPWAIFRQAVSAVMPSSFQQQCSKKTATSTTMATKSATAPTDSASVESGPALSRSLRMR